MKTQEPNLSQTPLVLNQTTLKNNANDSKKIPSPEEIQAWVVSYIAQLLEIEADKLDVKIPFDRYGLDSSAAVGLTGDLSDWLGCEIDPTLLYDYPTIESLVKHVSSDLN